MFVNGAKRPILLLRDAIYNTGFAAVSCTASAGTAAGCCYTGRRLFNIGTPVLAATKIGAISMLAMISLSIFSAGLRKYSTFDRTDTVLLIIAGIPAIAVILQPYIPGLTIPSSIAFSILGITPTTIGICKLTRQHSM